jgi:hypothetical protein
VLTCHHGVNGPQLSANSKKQSQMMVAAVLASAAVSLAGSAPATLDGDFEDHLIDIPQAITEAGHAVHAGDRLGQISTEPAAKATPTAPTPISRSPATTGPTAGKAAGLTSAAFKSGVGCSMMAAPNTPAARPMSSPAGRSARELMSNNGADFEACRPVPFVSLKASGVRGRPDDCLPVGSSLRCRPDGTTCQIRFRLPRLGHQPL